MFILVTGGTRSGRSNYALRRAAELGPPPWMYVTGGEETDEAIRKRIERHRRDNEAIWRTAPIPSALPTLIEAVEQDGVGALVLDGFVGWIAGRLASLPAEGEPALLAEIEALSDRLARTRVPIIAVTQELGQTLPPPADSPAARLLRVVASSNQIMAAQASALVLMVAGQPLRIA